MRVLVQVPKDIKDGWRSKLANALFAMGARTGKHDSIKKEFSAVLSGIHSSSQVANYFRFQVDANSRAQAIQGVLTNANVSPILVVVAAKALRSGYLRDLEQVYDHYLELLAAGTKELKGTVYSADKLSEADMSSVRAALMKSMVKAGSNLVLTNEVESSVLGGIRVLVWTRLFRCMLVDVLRPCELLRLCMFLFVQVGNTYVDLSLRKRLSALTSRQKSDDGDVLPLVYSEGEPAIWQYAREDAAAGK
jgi:F0F1-type ATP synthase delta subunit